MLEGLLLSLLTIRVTVHTLKGLEGQGRLLSLHLNQLQEQILSLRSLEKMLRFVSHVSIVPVSAKEGKTMKVRKKSSAAGGFIPSD